MNAQVKGLNSPKIQLLKPEEVLTLRPSDRDTYAEKVIREFLIANTKGITVSEIEAITDLNRSTITKHLKHLVAIREATFQKRGNLSIYFKSGKVTSTHNIFDSINRSTSYCFNRVTNEGENYIYIQEISEDYFGNKKVCGGIMLRDEDFMGFMKELQKFAMEATE
jgi:hypothetical protein